MEAIESEFVPLAIHNNKPGADAEVLELYGEAAWNNPVLRFFGHDGKELLPRRDRVWREHEVSARMIAALEAAGRAVPGYLRLAAEETDPGALERAVFAMACFWKGEASLGGLAGVKSTRAGFLEGREVVEVRYDPRALEFQSLVREAKKLGCLEAVYVDDEKRLGLAKNGVGERAGRLVEDVEDAPASDQLYHLGRSPLRFLPLTAFQAMRVNSALESGRDVHGLLSPRQVGLLARVKAKLALEGRAFEGMTRPTRREDLASYAIELEKRL